MVIQPYTAKQLRDEQIKLLRSCLIHHDDAYKIHRNREKGLEILNNIILRADFTEVNAASVVQYIWCVMSCIHHFQIWLRLRDGLLQQSRRQQYNEALKMYDKLIRIFMPDMYDVILQAIVTFYSQGSVWRIENLCSELLIRLVAQSDDPCLTINEMLNMVEKTCQTNLTESKEILKVLYEILEKIKWKKIDIHLLRRFLKMYKESIFTEGTQKEKFVPLRKGLENCVRHVLSNLENDDLLEVIEQMMLWIKADLPEDTILEFGNVLEFTAMRYKTESFTVIAFSVLPSVLDLIKSSDNIQSLLGNRLFHHLLDRHGNREMFKTPKIFYEDTFVNIKIAKYSSEDKLFFRNNRQSIHFSLLTAALRSAKHRISLENTYASIALLLVEIPCGYTAAAGVCLAMGLQETALSDEQMTLEEAHRIHATVMAIMSLICYMHNADVFYEYVNTIMQRRATFAPFLNPPIQYSYNYAQCHVLWKKPDLFFEDWEVRYGLWKCFRTKRANFQVFSGKLVTVNQ